MSTAEIVDPFAETAGDDDPFATSEDAASNAGPWVPWPGIDAVAERLIVLVPRTHDKEAKVSQYLQDTYNLPPTREEWKADLVVLGGAVPFSFPYRSKVQDTADQYEEKTHTVDALPFLVPGWSVTWGNILGVLNRLAGGPRPFALGRIHGGYSAAETRKGKTFADHKAELDAYYASPRGKTQPRTIWHFVVSDSAEDRATAMAWWTAARAEGFTA